MKLYKYYPPENCEIILTSQGDVSLRFSQPSTLNDPFDLSPSIDISEISTMERAKEMAKKINTSSKYYMDGNTGEYFLRENIDEFARSEEERTLKRKVNDLKRYNDKEIGVLSLSKNRNSALMWSHYAKNHQGFLIEIENSFDINNYTPPEYQKAEKVKYHKERPKTKLSESYSDKSYFLYKDPSWRYEKEMRLVVELSSLKTPIQPKNTSLPCYCHLYPVSKLNRIVIGALCPLDKEKYIRKWASEFAPKTIVEKAYLSPIDYQIAYKQSPVQHAPETPNT